MKERSQNYAVAVAVAGMILSLPATGADWQLEPTVRASEIYRSNANLGPSGDEEHAWITEIAPGFKLRASGANNMLDLDYRLQGLIFRGDIDNEDVFHEARLNGAFQLAEDRLYLDLTGRYDQQNIDPAGRVSLDNTFDAGNRTDVGVGSISPYWRQPVGDIANSLVRYTYSHVSYFSTDDSTTNVEDSDANAIEWTLTDNSSAKIGWETYYTYRHVEFDDSPEYEYQKAKGQLSYEVGSRTRLVVAGGSESDVSEDSSQGSLGESFYEGGFIWEPTSLQSLEARVGDRFYGTSWEVHYRRRGSRGNLKLDYTEDPKTSSGVLFDDSVFRPDGNLGAPRQDAEVFLRKRFAAGLDYEFTRSKLSVSAYRDERDYEVNDEDDTYWGLRSSLTLDLAPRTELVLNGNYEHQDLDGGQGENDLAHGSAEIRRTLRQSMTLGLKGSYYTRDSDESADYDDASGMLRFEATF